MEKFNGMKRASMRVTGFASALMLGTCMYTAEMINSSPAMAQEGVIHLSSQTNTKSIQVGKGKTKTLKADKSFSEIVVGDPEIAVVTPLTDRTFYIVGTKPGITGIALYDENRDLVGMLDIEVGPDTSLLNKAIQSSGVKAQSSNGRVVLTGKAKNPAAAAKARNIAKNFDEDLIDSTTVLPSTQVTLEVRFIEAARRKDKELGLSVLARKPGKYIGGTGGLTGLSLSSVSNSLISGAMPFGQILGTMLNHGVNVDVLVQALEQKGVARRLAEPNLTALSGDTASFLAGGEFPVPVAADNDRITIEFKKFGVGLDFTPTVLENGMINLQIAPEVSQIDPVSAVKFNDVEIPGLIVRRAETTVELRDGQSFVMAGMLQSNTNYDLRKFPWLGDIPILGALFRSSAYRKKETDLVIIVTPRLVRPMAPGTQIASPLDGNAPPNDVDLFLNGKTEISRANLRRVAAARAGAPRSGHIIDF
ncbi:MAG: type II and III secretion system protein family protein [Rhizobiaceae bacterium]